MEIKSNTFGKLSKIREGSVFSNELIFIKEFMQNAQRGKSKELRITMTTEYIRFKDDGIGCKNPDNVFTLDKSEWSTTDEGFGVGFWSCLALEELESIEVKSRKWRAFVDVKSMFQNKDLTVKKEEFGEACLGFDVRLNLLSLDYSKKCKLEEQIKEVAKYLDFDIYLNEDLLEKVDIFEGVHGDFVKEIDTQLFKAKISVSDYRRDRIQLFYDRREVAFLYEFNYVVGVIEPKKGKLTLKEPDRTDYVWDGKWLRFEEKLKKEIKKLYIDFLKSDLSDEIITKYSEAINEYLEVKEYVKFLFSDIDLHENESEDGYYQEITKKVLPAINTKQEEVSYIGIDDKNMFNEEKVEKKFEDVLYSEPTESISCEELECEKDNVSRINYSDELNKFNEGIEEANEELVKFDIEDFKNRDYKVVQAPINCLKEDFEFSDTKCKNKKNFKNEIKNIKNMVWVSNSEVYKYSDEISLAEYCNLIVYKAKNILYENVLRECGKLHLSELKDSLIETFEHKNIGLKNKKEIAFVKLLIPICKKYGLPINVFNIANLSKKTELKLDGKVVYKNIEKSTKDNPSIHAVSTGDNILLDRNFLNLTRFSITDGKMGINELKAVMFASKTIAHELAHHLYGTIDNTMEHYKIENILYYQIMQLYIN